MPGAGGLSPSGCRRGQLPQRRAICGGSDEVRLVTIYPTSEPFDHDMLDVGDRNLIYWEICGNPLGKPALVLHGGPGSGCTPGMRRFFDPAAYRIVLFDQRGCGRSIPHASDYAVDLASNTTHHLIRDIERLREHLTIDRWLVFGGSWGSTLALAYGERFPERVWEKAAEAWCRWEDAHVAVHSDSRPNARYEDPRFRMAFARLVTHYWHHAAWLEDGSLLRDVGRLAAIPAVLIHGRIDLSSPIDIPWQLGQRWPSSELVIVDNAGHGIAEPGVAAAVIAATDRFARWERADA